MKNIQIILEKFNPFNATGLFINSKKTMENLRFGHKRVKEPPGSLKSQNTHMGEQNTENARNVTLRGTQVNYLGLL